MNLILKWLWMNENIVIVSKLLILHTGPLIVPKHLYSPLAKHFLEYFHDFSFKMKNKLEKIR